MSKPCEDEIDKRNLDYLGGSECRDMRSIDEKSYQQDDQEHDEDEVDGGWTNQNQSPLAGRMSGTMEQLERIQSSEVVTSDEVRECLKDSIDCYQTCTETTLRCLTIGGKHVQYEHLNLLMDCAKICSTNADFILRNSTYYPQVCGITADICDECADTCDRFDDDFMKECASVCRRCAESCREMAR